MRFLSDLKKMVVRSRTLISTILLVAVAGGALFWFLQMQLSNQAKDAIQSKSLEISNEEFITVILTQEKNDVHNFIALGFNAASQNSAGLTGLAAAAQAGDPDILADVIATLPHSESDKMNVIEHQDRTGRNAVIAAAVSGKANILRMLLSKIPPNQIAALMNTAEKNGKNALYYTVLRDNPALLNDVLAAGADPTRYNNALETPIVVAIKLGANDLIPTLIAADTRVNSRAVSLETADNSGATALMHAIRTQNLDIINILIKAGADISKPDQLGFTPLMMAAQMGNQQIAELLIADGAKLEVADRFGNTPLTVAIKNDHPELAQFLISKGASVDYHTTDISPLQAVVENKNFDPVFFNSLLQRAKQTGGLNPQILFSALQHKNPALMKTLLDTGLNPNITNDKGESLFYTAIMAGDEDVVLMLIDKGVDIRQTGVAGITPLQLAVEHNEVKVVNKLLAMGAAFKEKTAEGYTLAEMAVYQGRPEILDIFLNKGATVDLDFCVLWAIRDGHGKSVGVLLNHGANPNVLNENGETALWLASEAGEVEAVQAFVEHHAVIDYPDKRQGITPLMIASHNGQLAVVKALVQGQAKIDIKDGYGMTALGHAAYMSKPDVVAYLLSKGADPSIVDSQGRTALDLASIAQPASDARNQIIIMLKKALGS